MSYPWTSLYLIILLGIILSIVAINMANINELHNDIKTIEKMLQLIPQVNQTHL